MKVFNSLKFKITIVIIIINILLIGSTIFFSNRLIADNMTKVITNSASNNIMKDAESIGIMLQERIKEMKNYASTAEVKSMDWEIMRGYLEYQANENSHIYEMIYISEPNGDVQATRGNSTNISEREYFSKVMRGETLIVDPVISLATGNLVSVIATPVLNDGKVVGLLGSSVNLELLSTFIENFKINHQDSYSYIIDSKGRILAHRDFEFIYNAKISEESEYISKEIVSVSDKILNNDNGKVDYTNNGVKTIEYYNIIPNTNGWKLITRVPNDFITNPVKNITQKLLIILVVGLIVSIITGFGVGGWLATMILTVASIIDRLAKYDLSFDKNHKAVRYLERKDEIGVMTKSLSTMQINFIELIKSMSGTSENLASSSEELTAISEQSYSAMEEVARTIEDIAAGANEQAKDTEQGAVNINELGNLIDKNQIFVDELNKKTNEVSSLKDEGTEILKGLVEKTEENNKATVKIHNIIVNTNESAERIETASGMIKSIAEQTNLLALNAAIEAARAGDAGRGFAVVADEIRKLADQSNMFTKEIQAVIKELTEKTSEAVDTIQEVGKLVATQTNSVEMTSIRFEGINSAIEKMKKVIEDINISGEKMGYKKNEIIDLIQNLSAVSEESAASTEEVSATVEEQSSSMVEIASASEALAKLAEEMQSGISKFKL